MKKLRNLIIRIEEKTYEKLRKEAFQKRKSMNTLVKEALEIYFQNRR